MSKYENVQSLVGYIRDEYILPNQMTYIEIEDLIKKNLDVSKDVVHKAIDIIDKDEDVEARDKDIITRLLLKSVRKKLIQLESESVSLLKSDKINTLLKYNKLCLSNSIYISYADIVFPHVIIEAILKIPPKMLIEECENKNLTIDRLLNRKIEMYLNSFIESYSIFRNISKVKRKQIINRVLSNDKMINREKMLIKNMDDTWTTNQLKVRANKDRVKLISLFVQCEKIAKNLKFKGKVELLNNSIKITVSPDKLRDTEINSISIGLTNGYRYIYIHKGDKLEKELKFVGTPNEISDLYLSEMLKDVTKELKGVFKKVLEDTAFTIKNIKNENILSEV